MSFNAQASNIEKMRSLPVHAWRMFRAQTPCFAHGNVQIAPFYPMIPDSHENDTSLTACALASEAEPLKATIDTHKVHQLLVANRGEIAIRILQTAKRLGLYTVSVYTQSDATSPHVLLADEAVALRPDDSDPVSNSRGYLDAETIVEICKERNITLVHPGYGFLSENAHFARLLSDSGITFLGPRPETIQAMGLKHEARMLAMEVDVPLVPGSHGLLENVEDAAKIAALIGFPVMLKSTAGGGGMGLAVCQNEEELSTMFTATRDRAQVSSIFSALVP
ncbi:uncharacterized protein FIBRA_02338 [Fibroporia radiculosa]|uniref:Biotin carboxylation domain-containing protein n=1 Tax=Fibroporia radiculosa TaxID=599839 RepID=J4G1M4_9APHY|nr:uncharacterized protein FIBRA_02338 [Fibroporia radiculosa]CCM00308.1 predicted protein [Fibroporia radiculosa]